MPIEIEGKQAVVSCRGDIAVSTFGPAEDTNGVAWLAMEEGPQGEPGRPLWTECPEKAEPRMLQDIEGVLIAADDPRSLDVIIECLVDLRARLRGEVTRDQMEAEMAAGMARETAKDVDRQLLADVEAAVADKRGEEKCKHDYCCSEEPCNGDFPHGHPCPVGFDDP